jgi:hypothetical protein
MRIGPRGIRAGDELTRPNPCNMTLARTGGYTNAVKVWAMFCRPVPNPNRPIRTKPITVSRLATPRVRVTRCITDIDITMAPY